MWITLILELAAVAAVGIYLLVRNIRAVRQVRDYRAGRVLAAPRNLGFRWAIFGIFCLVWLVLAFYAALKLAGRV